MKRMIIAVLLFASCKKNNEADRQITTINYFIEYSGEYNNNYYVNDTSATSNSNSFFFFKSRDKINGQTTATLSLQIMNGPTLVDACGFLIPFNSLNSHLTLNDSSNPLPSNGFLYYQGYRLSHYGAEIYADWKEPNSLDLTDNLTFNSDSSLCSGSFELTASWNHGYYFGTKNSLHIKGSFAGIACK